MDDYIQKPPFFELFVGALFGFTSLLGVAIESSGGERLLTTDHTGFLGYGILRTVADTVLVMWMVAGFRFALVILKRHSPHVAEQFGFYLMLTGSCVWLFSVIFGTIPFLVTVSTTILMLLCVPRFARLFK